MTTESRLRRKKKSAVLEIVFYFLFSVVFWYGVSYFIMENRLWRLLAAIAMAALTAVSIATDKTLGEIQPGTTIRCPRCYGNGIKIERTGKGGKCKLCKRESTWAEIDFDRKNSGDGA